MRKYIEPLWKSWSHFKAKQALLALMATSCIFLVISYSIRKPGVDILDLDTTRALQRLRFPFVDLVMKGFTFLGNSATLITLCAILAIWLFRRGRSLAAWLAMLSLLGLPLNMALKVWVGRPRPSADLVSVLAPTIGLSFPSGHAMASTAFYGYLAVLAWMHVPCCADRWKAMLGFAFTALMVSVSRIYLGAHWLSDVIGGWTAGLFLLTIIVEVYKHWGKKELASALPTVSAQNVAGAV